MAAVRYWRRRCGRVYRYHDYCVSGCWAWDSFEYVGRGLALDDPNSVRSSQESIQLSGAYATRQTSERRETEGEALGLST
jgi:hypothetical protein